MAILLTLDASVYVAACRSQEPGHAASRKLLACIRDQGIPMVEPMIVQVEVACALARSGVGEKESLALSGAIAHLPNVNLVVLDELLCRQASEVGSRHGLRGADAIYVATAQRYAAVLVSLDNQQLSRIPGGLLTVKPQAALDLLAEAGRGKFH